MFSACRRPPSGPPSDVAAVAPLFGPAVPREVIGGRADDGQHQVWLLAGDAIVRIDLTARTATRASIALPKGNSCWGLARLADGTLWTIRGRRTLAQVGVDGRIVREVVLAEPHFGLYARGDRLVYQPARFLPSGTLLFAGVPGDAHPAAWSGIEPRRFPALARASAAALNMVACGPTRSTEQPCWFPDDTSVALIGPSGQTRRVALSGLTRVAPEVLLATDNPARPLRDVFVDERGTIWVLSSGTPPPGAEDQPGGWLLAEYTSGGTLVRIRRLTEPVRLILDVRREGLVVLSGAGMVAKLDR
jgi:hypothetical protein